MLNETQRTLLEGFIQFPLEDIEDAEIVPIATALRAIGALLQLYRRGTSGLYELYQDEFQLHGILGSIDQLRQIAEHPAPQNRSTDYPYAARPADPNMLVYKDHETGRLAFERRGLLSLSAKNDATAEHVTKEDVIGFIVERLEAEEQRLEELERVVVVEERPAEAVVEVNERYAVFFRHDSRKLHKLLMQTLARELGVDYNEVYLGTVAEQTLVGMAGIFTEQSNAQYRPLEQLTRFELCFTNEEEVNRFYSFYKHHLPQLPLERPTRIGGERWEVLIDTNALIVQLAPALGEFYRNSHILLMKTLIEELRVNPREVTTGDAVESTLVRMAGINAEQSRAMFRANANRSTRFRLALSGAETERFREYYSERFPGLLLNFPSREAGMAVFDLNTSILIQKVAPALAEFRAATQEEARPPRVPGRNGVFGGGEANSTNDSAASAQQGENRPQ